MPAGRVSMRQVREILRLCSVGVSKHEIARRTGLAPSTIRETAKRFAEAGLAWPLPDDLTDTILEAKLYKNAGTKQGHRRQAEPDWAVIHRELKRKHVTLSILWDEYIEQHPDGYRYSRFCDLYRSWEGKLSVTMRQAHGGGEKLFVDYAGDKMPVVIDRLTGEIREAWIFVAVLGASSFTYAEATWTQGLADWIGAHTRAFEAIGGVPRLVVPDNTKTAVIKACLYEPSVNRTYTEMAAHYDTAILPTRPRRPRDKAKVEAGVLIMERWILGRLRNRCFHSLAELNEAIRDLLVRLNDTRPIRRLGVTRRHLLEELDRPMLKPLPVEPYLFAEWRLRRVGIDYHVEVERHYYSTACPIASRRLREFANEGGRRGSTDRANHRGVRQGRAHRRPFAFQRQRQAHHPSGSYAVKPSTLCRLDHRAHPARGGPDRPIDRGAVQPHPGRTLPSRTGLPCLPRHRSAGQGLRYRASGSGNDTGDRHRRPDLWLGQIHPRQQSRSPCCPPPQP